MFLILHVDSIVRKSALTSFDLQLMSERFRCGAQHTKRKLRYLFLMRGSDLQLADGEGSFFLNLIVKFPKQCNP